MLKTWENMSSVEPGLYVVHPEEQMSVEENGQECVSSEEKQRGGTVRNRQVIYVTWKEGWD